jgi:hypothetical protein
LGIQRLQFPYGFWMVVFILAPLQGFNNALVYYRPRIVRRMAAQKQRKTQDQQQEPPPSQEGLMLSSFERFRQVSSGPVVRSTSDALRGDDGDINQPLPGEESCIQRTARSMDAVGMDEQIEPAVYIAASLEFQGNSKYP